MQLPRGVHPVNSRGRTYYYFQEGRGTDRAGPRIRLPDDPRSPEFWQAIRQAQGLVGPAATDTINALCDAFELTFDNRLSDGTQDQYRRALRTARDAWGALPSAQLRPKHVRAMMEGLVRTPGKANNFIGAMRALSEWALGHGHIDVSLTQGVEPYAVKGGHRPWTPAQIAAAHTELTGVIRRGVMLYLYTGQRGSDVVRLGWTDVDRSPEGDGFDLTQQKTDRPVWCPIVPELAAEMATWERRPGPFLLQESGKPFTRKLFSKHFDKVRAEIPALAGTTLHGLRCTAVIRLRREGLSVAQITDIVGMSMPMVARYCRFADRKASGQAALLSLTRTKEERNCKTPQNWKAQS